MSGWKAQISRRRTLYTKDAGFHVASHSALPTISGEPEAHEEGVRRGLQPREKARPDSAKIPLEKGEEEGGK